MTVTSACEVYDPPPAVTLGKVEGKILGTTPITLVFSEPIAPETLAISFWPDDERDLEGRFRPEVRPIVAACTLAGSPCGVMTLALDDRGTTATIVQNGALAAYEGRPLVLQVHAGLADREGRVREVTTSLKLTVSPLRGSQPVDVDLASGVMTLTGPLITGVQLRMLLDFAVDSQTGEVVAVATFAELREAEPSFEANYPFPDAFVPELSENGWALAFTGWIAERNGALYFQSDPFDIRVLIRGIFAVELLGFTIEGTLMPKGATQADCVGARALCVGRDRGAGTLTTASATLNGEPIALTATTWIGYGLSRDEVAGHRGMPRTCAAEPCVTMDAAGGDCQLEAPWVVPVGCP